MSILHKTTVDIGELRTMPKPLHLMQYDKSLPEIEVSITRDGQAFEIPSSYSAEIRWGKPDCHGCTATGTISGSTVTFVVTEQMACVAGRSEVTVQLSDGDGIAGTAKFDVIVDRNPIGDSTIVSDSEIADIEKAIEAGVTATTQAQIATNKASEAAQSAGYASSYKDAAKTYSESASASKDSASASASAASTKASEASASATSAKESATSASASASTASNQATIATTQANLAKQYAETVEETSLNLTVVDTILCAICDDGYTDIYGE